jgi:hypothetical protein
MGNRPQKLLDQVRDTIRLNHYSMLPWTHCGIPIAPISEDVQRTYYLNSNKKGPAELKCWPSGWR